MKIDDLTGKYNGLATSYTLEGMRMMIGGVHGVYRGM
jgi:hypothetical protein